MEYAMRLELTCVGLLIELANHNTTGSEGPVRELWTV